MSDEPFALSTIPPVLPEEADFDAICTAVMATVRGRWFLEEYARRNRNADTTQVLAAIERIEAVIREDHSQRAGQGLRVELLEMARAIAQTRNIVAERSPMAAPPDAMPEVELRPDIVGAAERLRDIAWTMRERAIEPAACAQIEALATTVLAASSLRDPDNQRAQKLSEVLQYLEHRIDRMLDSPSGEEPAQPDVTAGTAAAGASQARADNGYDPDDPAADGAPESESAMAAPPATELLPQSTIEIAAAADAPAGSDDPPMAETSAAPVEPAAAQQSQNASDAPVPADDSAVERFEWELEPLVIVPAGERAQDDAAFEPPPLPLGEQACDTAAAAPEAPAATPAQPPHELSGIELAPLVVAAPAGAVVQDIAAPPEPAVNVSLQAPPLAGAVVDFAAFEWVIPEPQPETLPDAEPAAEAPAQVTDQAPDTAESGLAILMPAATPAAESTQIERKAAAIIAEAQREVWPKTRETSAESNAVTQAELNPVLPEAAIPASAQSDPAAAAAVAMQMASDLEALGLPTAEAAAAVAGSETSAAEPAVPNADAETQAVAPPQESEVLSDAWETGVIAGLHDALRTAPTADRVPSMWEPPVPAPTAAVTADDDAEEEPAAFLLEPLRSNGGAHPVAPNPALLAQAPANDALAIEGELFAGAIEAAAGSAHPSPQQPAATAAIAATAAAQSEPAPVAPAPAPPPVHAAPKPMPHHSVDDPLAALKAMSDEERIALFT